MSKEILACIGLAVIWVFVVMPAIIKGDKYSHWYFGIDNYLMFLKEGFLLNLKMIAGISIFYVSIKLVIVLING